MSRTYRKQIRGINPQCDTRCSLGESNPGGCAPQPEPPPSRHSRVRQKRRLGRRNQRKEDKSETKTGGRRKLVEWSSHDRSCISPLRQRLVYVPHFAPLRSRPSQARRCSGGSRRSSAARPPAAARRGSSPRPPSSSTRRRSRYAVRARPVSRRHSEIARPYYCSFPPCLPDD